MNTNLLNRKRAALDAALWPLGKPTPHSEPPLWQAIVKEWARTKMRPVGVSFLVDDLLRCGGDDSFAAEIVEAIDAAGNWEEVARAAGWLPCDELIAQLSVPGDHGPLLGRLLSLVSPWACEGPSPVADVLFYWLRSADEWEGDQLVARPTLLAHRELADGVRRSARSALEEVSTAAPSMEWATMRPSGVCYSTAWAGADTAVHSLGALLAEQPDCFLTGQQLLDGHRDAVTAWLVKEWLEPQGFVNLDAGEWSSTTNWQALGAAYGYEHASSAVAAWYLIDEAVGEYFRDAGEVLVESPGGQPILWGRRQGGQDVWMDRVAEDAMVCSGYLDKVPPLGALFPGAGVSCTLGGEEFPFCLEAPSTGILLPEYRAAGWTVAWEPVGGEAEFEPKFKLAPNQHVVQASPGVS